jgi:hypothetical protein
MTTAVGPERPESVDWHAYRQCAVCRAPSGWPCLARSGRIVGGQPDQQATTMAYPHLTRQLRTNYRPGATTPPGSA